MDYLARRELSFYELETKLNRKYPDTGLDLIRQTIDGLRKDKLQCDQRFAESYVRYRKSRGFAYHHIKNDLSSRGVDDSIIAAQLFMDDDDWLTMLEESLSKKLGSGRLEFGSKQHRRMLRFLESRGFPSLLVRKSVEKRLEFPLQSAQLD